MTEEGWLSSDDPVKMFRFLTENIAMKMAKNKLPPTLEDRKPSDRKWRLFCCACCIPVGMKKVQVDKYKDHGYVVSDLEWAKDWVSLRIVSVTQKYKANLIRDIIGNPFRRDHVHVPYHKSKEWFTPQVLSLAQAAYEESPGRTCYECTKTCEPGRLWTDSFGGTKECHCCYGKGRVEDGALDPLRLSILADALEEAGCPVEAADEFAFGGVGPHPLLVHLRSPGVHVRGCWALDIILGK